MAERMTVARLAVMVSGLEARMVAVERAIAQGGTKTGEPVEAALKPTRAEQQQAAMVAELGTRMTAVEKVVLAEDSSVIIRHTSRAVMPVDPAMPEVGGLQQCFAHYRLPAGVARGQVRIARITGQGSKGRGYANLRVELNGDEGWGQGEGGLEGGALWLVVSNAPYSTGDEPDTWRMGWGTPGGIRG